MGGKMSRNKGAAWERKVARMLRAAGVPAKRGLGQARSASEVADNVMPRHWPEMKCGAPALYPLKALKQAVEASWAHFQRTGIYLQPVAICKPDRKQPTATWFYSFDGRDPVAVTVSLKDWIQIVAAEHRARDG